LRWIVVATCNDDGLGGQSIRVTFAQSKVQRMEASFAFVEAVDEEGQEWELEELLDGPDTGVRWGKATRRWQFFRWGKAMTDRRIATAWICDRSHLLSLDEGDVHIAALIVARHFECYRMAQRTSGAFLLPLDRSFGPSRLYDTGMSTLPLVNACRAICASNSLVAGARIGAF
jgi:hypothetical protein